MPYVEPTAADLKARYPAFAAVSDGTLGYWITDAARFVDQSWGDADYGPAKLAIAAHNMVLAGAPGIAGSDVAGLASTGLTSFRSGAFSANFSEAAAKRAVDGGLPATSYGQEYLALLSRNKGGARVTAAGAVPCSTGFNGWAGPLPPYIGCG